MSIKHEINSGILSLKANGELTIYSVKETLDSILSSLNACSEINLDLSDVSEFDTAGLQLLIAIKNQSDKTGSKFSISESSACVDNVINKYDLQKLLIE